jgi:hypothetical protein
MSRVVGGVSGADHGQDDEAIRGARLRREKSRP